MTLWRHREFLKLWTAQTISVFGDNFTALALPILGALTLNATPGQMGILTAVERLPFLVAGLLAGVWVDRIRRRPVLIAGDLGRGLVLLSIPLAATLGALGNAAAIGVIFSVGNVAALAGALAAGRLGARLGVGRVIIASAIAFGVGAVPIIFAQKATAYPLLILSGLVFSFFNPVYNINQVSLRQAITPQRLQGRMNATMRFLVWGTMPLGGLLGGALGDRFGLRTAIGIGAAGIMTAFLWVLFSPVRGLRAIPEPEAEEAERGPRADATMGTSQAPAPP